MGGPIPFRRETFMGRKPSRPLPPDNSPYEVTSFGEEFLSLVYTSKAGIEVSQDDTDYVLQKIYNVNPPIRWSEANSYDVRRVLSLLVDKYVQKRKNEYEESARQIIRAAEQKNKQLQESLADANSKMNNALLEKRSLERDFEIQLQNRFDCAEVYECTDHDKIIVSRRWWEELQREKAIRKRDDRILCAGIAVLISALIVAIIF